jgi:hypothetical protein
MSVYYNTIIVTPIDRKKKISSGGKVFYTAQCGLKIETIERTAIWKKRL